MAAVSRLSYMRFSFSILVPMSRGFNSIRLWAFYKSHLLTGGKISNKFGQIFIFVQCH